MPDLRSKTSGEQRFLIASGTQKYADSAQWGELRSVPDDLRRISDSFGKLGYHRVLCELGENPTRNEFEQTLRAWFGSPSRSRDDRVVFYYSGHGELEESTNRPYLRLADGGVLTERLAEIILESYVQHALIILDTCVSGMGAAAMNGVAARLVGFEKKWDPSRPHGLYTVAAVRAADWAAGEGVLSTAIADVLLNPERRYAGSRQKYLSPPTFADMVQTRLKSLAPYQTIECRVPTAISGVSHLIPNIRYLPGLDEWNEFNGYWMPLAKSFTGRHRARSELLEWLNGPKSAGTARVVTGGPGTGKSAILAWLVTRSRSDYRQKHQAEAAGSAANEEGLFFPVDLVDVAIVARGKTLNDIVAQLADALDSDADDETALIGLIAARDRRLVIVIDALDEATEPRRIARDLLRKLTNLDHVWLLIGGQPDYPVNAPKRVRNLGGRVIEIDLDRDDYFCRRDIVEFVKSRLLSESSYRDDPTLAESVADGVASKAGKVFLIASIISDLFTAGESINTRSPEWQGKIASEICEVFDSYLDRFDRSQFGGLDKQTAVHLLRALAYSEGEGMPWDDVWAPVARAISGRNCTDSDVEALLKYAGTYIIEAQENQRPVYRLYHQSLANCLRDTRRETENQRRIVHALKALVPKRVDGAGADWLKANPYIRTHLATHAAGAGCIDELLTDALFLIGAEPIRLLRALRRSRTPAGRQAARIYSSAAHYHSQTQIEEWAYYLELTARQHHADVLSQQFAMLPLRRRWTIPWSHSHPADPHRVLKAHDSPVLCIGLDMLHQQSLVASAGRDGVRLWDLITGAALEGSSIEHVSVVTAIATLNDRLLIVSGDEVGTIRSTHHDTGDLIYPAIQAHRGPVAALAVMRQPNGSAMIVSGGADSAICLWDALTGKLLYEPIDLPAQ